jgi:hypothetical protein
MATLRFVYNAAVEVDGVLEEMGNFDTPAVITGVTSLWKRTILVAASGTDTLFNIDTECLSEFKFLIVAADYDLALEAITDDDGDIGEAIASEEIRGSGTTNQLGFPRIFSKDDSLANHTVGFNGTWDKIERIDCKNRSSTQAVKVTVWACK